VASAGRDRDAARTGDFMSVDPAVACLIIACTELLFAVAAIYKLRDLRRFAEIFAAYGVLPLGVARRVAPVVPLFELVVAFGLLFEGSRKLVMCVGIVLLLAYAVAIAINLYRGRRDLACGCGGPDDRRTIAGWMVWRNLGIASLMAAALLPWSDRPFAPTDAVTIGCGAVACALVYLCLDRLLGRTGPVTDTLRMT
jgi:hypothetical protein